MKTTKQTTKTRKQTTKAKAAKKRATEPTLGYDSDEMVFAPRGFADAGLGVSVGLGTTRPKDDHVWACRAVRRAAANCGNPYPEKMNRQQQREFEREVKDQMVMMTAFDEILCAASWSGDEDLFERAADRFVHAARRRMLATGARLNESLRRHDEESDSALRGSLDGRQ
jgi:hypothetical protein